jgi:hypothetical protein
MECQFSQPLQTLARVSNAASALLPNTSRLPDLPSGPEPICHSDADCGYNAREPRRRFARSNASAPDPRRTADREAGGPSQREPVEDQP